jgi:uncharacterized protein
LTAIAAYIGCGILAGLFGGYLGLGGGVVIVPFLTLVMDLDIKEAVPVSMAAIVVNSLASSSEYMKKNMVDVELMMPLGLSMVLGMIIGASTLSFIPSNFIKLVLTAVLLYTAVSMLFGKEKPISTQHAKKQLMLCSFLAFVGGILGGLVGVGGGILLIPIMFLIIGLPLSTSRGTSSFIVGFSGAASVGVYFLSGLLNFTVVPAVMLGTVIGGKLGGKLGTLAKPKAVKIVFFIVILWVAYKLASGALKELL